MYNARREQIREKMDARGISFNYEGYNHRDNSRYYKFVSDSSIRGNDTIECVSPVLKSSRGFASVKRTCEALNEADCRVNRSTGFHVHIGAADLTEEQYCNVFINYMHLEDVIDTFMSPSRRGDDCGWCHSLKGHNIQNVFTRDYLNRCLRSRYFKVNPESWGRHKTIEFRQHAGTINYEKIENWVKFCAQLIEWSKTHKLTSDITSIDDIEFISAKQKTFFKNRAAALNA